jgi:tight adherence protein B
MTRGSAIVLAGLAAGSGCFGVLLVLGERLRWMIARAGATLGSAGRLIDEVLAPLRRAGAEGRNATRSERRRLQAAFAAGSLPIALVLVDPVPALALAAASVLIAPRALVRRRERYTHALGEGAAAAATRIADALASGHTTRAAIAIAATELHGPIGRELSDVAADLELGATTDTALTAFRERAGARGIDLLVAAIRLQRRSGGNLATLLRDVAGALEDQARLEAEARAETAQARFTSTVVLAMPLCVLALGELASPGTIGRLAGSALGAWLLVAAAGLQAGGALLIRRLARVEA